VHSEFISILAWFFSAVGAGYPRAHSMYLGNGHSNCIQLLCFHPQGELGDVLKNLVMRIPPQKKRKNIRKTNTQNELSTKRNEISNTKKIPKTRHWNIM